MVAKLNASSELRMWEPINIGFLPGDTNMEIKIGRCIIVDYGHVKMVDAKTDKVESVLPRYFVWDTKAGVVDGDGSDDPNVLYQRYKKYDPKIVPLEVFRQWITDNNMMRKWFR